MKSNSKILIIIAAILMIIVSSCKKTNDIPSSGDVEIGIKAGQIAPEFTLPDKDGNEINLSDYRGQYVVIDFWASWCHFCREENPELVSLYADYRDKGFEIVGVSIDTDKTSWLNAVEADGIQYIQLIDIKGFESPVVVEYGVVSIPRMILLDPNGKILLVTSKASEVATVVRGKLD